MKGESRTYGAFERSLCVVCARVGASYAFVVVARRHGVGSTFCDTHGIVTLPIETSDSRLGARGVDFLTFPFGISVGRDVFFHRANLCVVGNARRVVSLSRRSSAARRRRASSASAER